MEKTLDQLFTEFKESNRHRMPSQDVDDYIKVLYAKEEPDREEFISSFTCLIALLEEFYAMYNAPQELLFEYGHDALKSAARRYEVKRGGEPSIYAIWWISQSMRQAISEWRGDGPI